MRYPEKSISTVASKAQERKELNDNVNSFLKSGGKIKHLPYGASSEDIQLSKSTKCKLNGK